MTWVKESRYLTRNDPKMPSIVFPGVCLRKYQLWRCQLRERIQNSNWLPRLRNVSFLLQIVWRKWTSECLIQPLRNVIKDPVSFQFSFQSPPGPVSPGWYYFIFRWQTFRTRREVISSHYSNLRALSFNQKSIANFLSPPLGYFGVTSSCQTILWSGSGVTPGPIRFTPNGEAMFSSPSGWCLG